MHSMRHTLRLVPAHAKSFGAGRENIKNIFNFPEAHLSIFDSYMSFFSCKTICTLQQYVDPDPQNSFRAMVDVDVLQILSQEIMYLSH